MIDRYLLKYQRLIFHKPAKYLVARGLSANEITVGGFVIGLTCIFFLAQQLYIVALVAILVNRLFDGLDGAMARIAGPTDRGAFFDIAFDFFAYASVPFGFVLANPETNALAGSTLLLSFVGTGSSFLSFAILAQKRGLASTAFPTKGLYYLGGLTEGAETIAFLIAMCLWPSYFPALAWIFSALCFITTISRWWYGWRQLS